MRFAQLSQLVGVSFTGRPFSVSRHEASSFQLLTFFTELETHETSSEVASGILEGFHTLALIDALFNEHLRFDRTECFVLNYGVDHLRFPRQLTVEDDLEFEMTIENLEGRGAGVVVSTRFHISRIGDAKPGVTGIWKLFVAPRAVPDGSKQTPVSDSNRSDSAHQNAAMSVLRAELEADLASSHPHQNETKREA